MIAEQRRAVAARAAGRKPLGADPAAKKPVGRPKGEPSTIVNVRLPFALLDRLDRYLDRLEMQTGLRANRGMIARRALQLFLETQETALRQPMPPANGQDRDAVHRAYQAIGHGRGFVRIHRLRAALGWSRARFDQVLRDLAADYMIELHGGDPSSLTAAALEDSYWDASGQVSLTVSWRG